MVGFTGYLIQILFCKIKGRYLRGCCICHTYGVSANGTLVVTWISFNLLSLPQMEYPYYPCPQPLNCQFKPVSHLTKQNYLTELKIQAKELLALLNQCLSHN